MAKRKRGIYSNENTKTTIYDTNIGLQAITLSWDKKRFSHKNVELKQVQYKKNKFS